MLSPVLSIGAFATAVSAISSSDPVSFTLVVTPTRMDDLKSAAVACATPGNPSYGSHLSAAQIYEMTRPTKNSFAAITSWLRGRSVTSFVVAKDLIAVNTTYQIASSLFTTTFSTVRGSSLTRAGAYTVPVDIAPHVAAVFGLTGRPLPRDHPSPSSLSWPAQTASWRSPPPCSTAPTTSRTPS